MRCLPLPLSVLCWLDNRYGPHNDTAGKWCRAHDRARVLVERMSFWRAA